MTRPRTVGAAVRETRRRLAAGGFDSAALEARLLVASACGCDAANLIGHPEQALADDQFDRLRAALERRLMQEPLAYILRQREFWSLPLTVTPDTLIPRPDSECLIEAARTIAKDRSGLRVLDLGTGSGCLLLALLAEFPGAWGIGIDRSQAALAVARGNAERLGLAPRANFVCSDWAAALAGVFEIVVSNPPYISDQEWLSLDPGVRDFEPAAALRAGARGTAAYEIILPQLERLLAPGGTALIEIGGESIARTIELVAASQLQLVEIHMDLAGRARCLQLSTPLSRGCKNSLGKELLHV
ncbi:MAG: peptide chain release factor N(5)-glutamine methyltransferase [Rhodospirillales bacterium]|nr:peptide chain release factor N(5)-glutamine methyltransferase [Rhodospirillales bacterium]